MLFSGLGIGFRSYESWVMKKTTTSMPDTEAVRNINLQVRHRDAQRLTVICQFPQKGDIKMAQSLLWGPQKGTPNFGKCHMFQGLR